MNYIIIIINSHDKRTKTRSMFFIFILYLEIDDIIDYYRNYMI
jgi:hypothetical protein